MTINKIDEFDITSSVVSLWVFKASRQRFFTVKIGDELINHFKSLIYTSFKEIKKYTPYDAASTYSKDISLTLDDEVPTWNEILHHLMQPVESRYVRSISGLQNNFAYIAVYKHNGKTLYAAKKISTNLGSKKSSSFIDSIFNGDTLEISENSIFGISKLIDFYYIDGTFYILNKDNFESILGFKEYYKKEYNELITSEEFINSFDNIPVLIGYVKENTTQLARMFTVKQKKKFEDKVYMEAFKKYNDEENWGIEIKNNKIVFTEDKVRDIINVMLGYRVKSLCDQEISDASGLIKIN